MSGPAPSRPCPICGKPAAETGDLVPFCSARCKMVDLGRWFRGEYRVPGEDVVALDPEDLRARLEAAGASEADAGGGPEPDA